VEEHGDDRGHLRVRWTGGEQVVGMPYDTPIAGYGCNTVNTLRLWRRGPAPTSTCATSTRATTRRRCWTRTARDHLQGALPSDVKVFGKELRLKQQYFFVACSLHDIVRRHLVAYQSLENFADKVAIQLNDTHPAVTIPELMRILVDEHGINWDKAWEITQATVGYTNHTLLAEALETWPVELFQRLLPRHLAIIYEVNKRFLRQVMSRYPFDDGRLLRMSLIDEGNGTPENRRIRMAYLAVVGSHSVNGVAALHTELLKAHLLHDFNEMFPERFHNVTNGVTPRAGCSRPTPCWRTPSPRASGTAGSPSSSSWSSSPSTPRPGLPQRSAGDQAAEQGAARPIHRGEHRIAVDRSSLFDVQVKRLHEYKRQLLNLLHVVALYLRLKKNPELPMVRAPSSSEGRRRPRTRRQVIIKLINSVASVINGDPQVNGKLRVIFLANYRVSLAERIFPASDLSEQISTAGKEASGTGNMKFSLNGALTIGTLDGANIEIREEVGPTTSSSSGSPPKTCSTSSAPGTVPATTTSRTPS